MYYLTFLILPTFLAYFRVFFHCLLLRWENCSTGDGKNRGLETLLPGGTGPWSSYIAYLGQQGSSSPLGYTGRKKEIPERLRPGDCWRPFPQWMTIQPVRLLRMFGAADYGKGSKAHQDGTTCRPCVQTTGVSNHSPLWGGGGGGHIEADFNLPSSTQLVSLLLPGLGGARVRECSSNQRPHPIPS